LNYKECQKINRAAEKAHIPVFVAYYRRALPGFLKVKDLISAGVIGKPLFVQLQLFKSPSPEELSGKLPWRVDPRVSGGGHFFDLASHQMDYLDFVFGPVLKLKSLVLNQARLYKAEDYVSAEFLFTNNIAGTGTWSFGSSIQSSRDTIEITGDKGYIKFSCFNFEPIVLENKDGRKEFVNEKPEHVQFFLIEQVVRALIENGTAVSTGITASRTSRVLDDIVKEYYR